MAMAEMPGPYDVRAYACRARGVATHTCTMAPYRGVSRPVITFAIERLMDKAAAAFDLGPDEIRRRNLIENFPTPRRPASCSTKAATTRRWNKRSRMSTLPAFRAQQRDARTRGRYLGIGFATFSERTGYGSPAFAARGMEITPGWETVEITMDPSGSVEARIGASPHGQGLRTTLAQIIADEIGVAPQHVRIVHGDTDRTPYGWGTFASRSLVIAGGASLLAAQKIRKKLLTIASHVLEAAPDDIVLENGNAKVSGTDRSVTIATLARAAYHQTHQFKGEITPGLTESADYDPPGTFSNACHVAIVEVDIETGRVTIEKFLAVEDAGRIINPMIADGQVHGGIAQGIGNALLEEIIYDDARQSQTATLADYMPPTAREIPPIELHHIETPQRRRSPAPRASAKAAPSARRRRSSTPSTTRSRRSASRSTRCRRRRNASARRCARRSGIRIYTYKSPFHLGLQNVCFPLKNGYAQARRACPLWANSCRTHPQQMRSHSTTSSARASKVGGTSMPRERAVCRLRVNSNLVGCKTGRSAGLAPLMMLPV